MASFVTLDLVHTIADPIIELIKKELDITRSIRWESREGQPHVEALHDQPATTDLGVACGIIGGDGVAGGVVDVGFFHVNFAARYDDEHVADAP